MLDQIKAWGWMCAAIVAGALLALQTWRLHDEQIARRDLVAASARQESARATKARDAEISTAASERAHAAHTQENSDAFTQSQSARDAAARADLDRLERLRKSADSRAAGYRAQAAACAAAGSGLANRLEALDHQLVEGVGVVAALRSDLERRDAEVTLLRGQIDADRALMAGP